MKLIKLEKSPRYNKRFRAFFDNNIYMDFGFKDEFHQHAITYIDGASREKRDAYISRHMGNKRENELVQSLIISPSLLSLFVLWNTQSLENNIKILNRLLEKKYNKI
jgi:hypothetical protein